jgi:hypothetical protein
MSFGVYDLGRKALTIYVIFDNTVTIGEQRAFNYAAR